MKHTIASQLFQPTTSIFSDPAPFGLEIGKATVADAEKMYRIEKIGPNRFNNGTVYNVSVDQVNLEGLKELTFVFNTNGVLAIVRGTLPKSQFKSFHHSFSKKYKVVRQDIPFVGDSFVGYVHGSTFILLDAPRLGFDMVFDYMNMEMFADLQQKIKSEDTEKRKGSM